MAALVGQLGSTPMHTVPVFSGPELAGRLYGLIDDMLPTRRPSSTSPTG